MSRELTGIKELVKLIPYELRMAMEGLSNEARQAIVVALKENERLRFSELRRSLSIPKSDLAFHLNRLMQAGLISHRYDKFPSEERYGYYCLSELGENLLQGIQESFVPRTLASPKRLTSAHSFMQDHAQLIGRHPPTISDGTMALPILQRHRLKVPLRGPFFVDENRPVRRTASLIA